MGRNVIAALFAALVVVAVAAAGWQLVDSRVNAPEAAPGPVLASVADALSNGEGLTSQLRSGGQEASAARAAVLAGLGIDHLSVEVGELTIEADDARASSVLTFTADSPEVGIVMWDAPVEVTRLRGNWGVDADASLIHPSMREGYLVEIIREEPSRAPIVGHDGTALTSHGNAWSLGIAPGRVVNEERLRTTWASLLPGSLDDLIDLLARTDTNPDWFYPLVTVTESTYDDVWPRLRGVPGTVARESDGQTPTEDAFGRHVLGRVGEPTAELAEELGVDPSERVGLYGLERLFEGQLTGSSSLRVVIVQPDGDEVAELATADQDLARPVETTIDADIQQAVENALAGVDEPVGIVVLEAATGAIRASASRPLGGYNRAWEGRYPPGDAFLPIAAEAVLAAGANLSDPVNCAGRESVAGALLLSPRALGETTLGDALAAGCDTTLGTAVAELDSGELKSAATRFWFDESYDLVLPGGGGSFPDPGDVTERVRAGAGQAQVLATPLHMAAAAAAAATGTWHPPFLLSANGPRPGTEIAARAAGDLRLILTDAARRTGSGAALGDVGASGLIGTAPVTGGVEEHAWALIVTDDVAAAVLVENTAGDLSLVTRIAQNFVRELGALRG